MQSTSKIYISRLDHLRFLAAFLVLTWHGTHFQNMVPTSEVPEFYPFSWFEEGHTGVSLFMVLSGFVFSAICLNKTINYFDFLRNRILRIFPLFFVWTLYLFYVGDVDPVKLFVSIFALLNKEVVPGVGWTVIVEFQFYVLFPFLVVFISKYGIRYLWWFLFLAVLFRAGVWLNTGSVQKLAYWTIFGRIDQFILGILGYVFYSKYRHFFSKRLFLISCVALLIAYFHWFNISGGYYERPSYPSPSPLWIVFPAIEGLLYSLLTICYISADFKINGLLDKFFANLGAMSYSIYLNHFFIIGLCYKAFASFGFQPIGFSQALAFVCFLVLPTLLLFSMLTYKLIEIPFLSLRKNYLQ